MIAHGIKETTATTGTGDITLSAVTGFLRFSNWFSDQALVNYTIMSGSDGSGGILEWGIGTITTATNVLARSVVLGTLSSGTLNTTNPTALSLTGTNLVLCSQFASGSIPNSGAFATNNSSSGGVVPYPHRIPGSAATVVIVADRLYLIPFVMPSPKRLTAVKFRVSGSGSGNMQMGIYAVKSDGNPGKLITSSGDVAVSTSGVHTWTLSTPVILPEDWYCMGIAFKGTTPSVNSSQSGASAAYDVTNPFNTDSTVVQPIAHKYAALSGGWTALSDPAPTSLTSGTTAAFPLFALVF